MDIKDYVKKYNLPFDKVKSEYDVEFDSLYESEKEWLQNLEDKVHLLKNEKDQVQVTDVINKLKSTEFFNENDSKILSTFVSKVNTIVRIANRINNFKEGTELDNGSTLKLYDFFNSVKSSSNLTDFKYPLNSNLTNFLPHIYSVIKHCQYPTEYPIYYKYWKNMMREVLSKDDDYDSMCTFYRTITSTSRHLNFATYLGVIGIQIAKNINSSGIQVTKNSKEYKYLTKEVINIERYNSILDENLNKDSQYFLVGAYWDGSSPADQSNRFVEKNIWENGYDDKFIEEVKAVKKGSKIAIKAAFTREKTKSVMAIKARGVVVKNYNDGKKLDVAWEKDFTPFEVDFSGGYWATIKEVTNEKHINIIWHSGEISDAELHAKVIYSYLKKSLSHRGIQKEVLGQDAPARGGGFLAMQILHSYKIEGDKKGILNITPFSTEYNNANGKYLEALDLLKEYYPEFANGTNKTIEMNFPLNTILYGPPGTGKTYNTVLRAAKIIENREIDSYEEALEIFKTNLHNQIEFITFHQNYSYEDFIQGLRPETDNKSSLVFEKKDGVFKTIADRALENLKQSRKDPNELSSEAKFDKALESFSDEVLENEDNFKINDTAYIFEVEEDAFRYTGEKWTNHTNGLRMKFSDLKEFYRNNIKSRKDIKGLSSISGLANQHATYYFLVYNQIIKYLPKSINSIKIENNIRLNKVLRKLNISTEQAFEFLKTKNIIIEKRPTTKISQDIYDILHNEFYSHPIEKVEKQNYVIIIDEINRANISRVFGELITLIEPDKRSHGAIPLEARLPSGDPFIVPSNLFIIGTMNTADKSIALLDIALRRRFEFESMYPKYEINGQEIYDVEILKKINEQIIKSKGHDFQIGHAYFMGDNKDLVQRMNKKVIPLLLEYYMNDEKEVKGILNSAGLIIEENSWPLKISGKND